MSIQTATAEVTPSS